MADGTHAPAALCNNHTLQASVKGLFRPRVAVKGARVAKDRAQTVEALTVSQLAERFRDALPTPAQLRQLQSDQRAAVRALADRLQARQARDAAERLRINTMTAYERPLWAAGVLHIAGCDEAGMSPLAGPVVAAAVVLRPDDLIPGVDDSKKLTAARREALAGEIKARAAGWGVGMAQPAEIDTLNVYHAGLLAMRRALEDLSVAPGHVLVDARTVPGMAMPQTPIIRGDALSLSIGAASIIAKTTRDRLMAELDAQYPGYGLAQHKGYPVAAHVAALRRLGPSPIHRRSFAPVREVMEGALRLPGLFGG